MTEPGDNEQLALVPASASSRPPVKPRDSAAPSLPVARVAVDMPHAHLDRLFDYSVPESLHETAIVGCRVKVRFAGKLVDGFVVDRIPTSMHPGRLGSLAKVVSAEPVLRPDVLRACRLVADRYAGTLADVLRFAIPPRHARTEKADSPQPVVDPLPEVDPTSWRDYENGPGFIRALASGRSARACWSAAPATDLERALAMATLATLHSGNGVIIVAPDVRDVRRLDVALRAVLGPDRHVTLTASQGPGERYRSFLALSRGRIKVVVGTRAAAFAPVNDLGLVAILDDGDDLYVEQRAPYPHAREVLLTRALDANCAVLVAGFARTCEAQLLVDTGWCRDIGPAPAGRRATWPRVEVTDGSERGSAPARLPREAFTLIRAALADGPVLMQVPRRGYRASLSCQECREPARCSTCQGPLSQPSATAPPVCRWCGHQEHSWRCPACGNHRLRAPVVGQLRTAEEIGKAFPSARVLTSAGAGVLDTVGGEPAIVLATPGAEPPAEGGYAAAVLLDTWLQLGRPDLRVTEEAHRRWFNAIGLVRPASAGGRVVVIGDPSALQALVRADPVGFAVRELADRRDAHLPPATRIATIEGSAEALAGLVGTSWPEPSDVLGPIDLDEDHSRLMVRVPRTAAAALARTLTDVQAERSAAKALPLRVQVDPYVL